MFFLSSAIWNGEGYSTDILNHLEGLRIQFNTINIYRDLLYLILKWGQEVHRLIRLSYTYSQETLGLEKEDHSDITNYAECGKWDSNTT